MLSLQLNRTSTGALGSTLHQIYVARGSASMAYGALVLVGAEVARLSSCSLVLAWQCCGTISLLTSLATIPLRPSTRSVAVLACVLGVLISSCLSTPSFDADSMLGGPMVTGGHTKGVFAADKNSGFYLIHSVPKFPDLRQSSFTWNASTTYAATVTHSALLMSGWLPCACLLACSYAQSFMCISMASSQVGEQLALHPCRVC
jgi:hypothetical protein